MRTTERRRRIARRVPPAMHDTPNMNGPAVPLPVWGRFPLVVVVGVVGAVGVGAVVVVGPPCSRRVVVVPGRVVVVNAVVTGGPSEVDVSGTVVVVSVVVVVVAVVDVSGAVVVVLGAVVVVS
jgi:hypothetical protein